MSDASQNRQQACVSDDAGSVMRSVTRTFMQTSGPVQLIRGHNLHKAVARFTPGLVQLLDHRSLLPGELAMISNVPDRSKELELLDACMVDIDGVFLGCFFYGTIMEILSWAMEG